ncbi:MAG TPA: hypothetical protein VJ020_11530 [Anaerolineales bacterium]|nr:hypothetical protein [Anaerolineales bacterium]
MNIPKYWAKETYTMENGDGDSATGECWGWSNHSVEDARQQARLGAQQHAQKILNRFEKPLDRYPYGVRAMREETVQAIADAQGKEIAIVTRNAYGALVLNAANAMFIDIDFNEEKPSGGLGRLFGGKAGPSQEQTSVERVEQWATKNPGVALRVYRTAGGLRCLITTDIFDPSQESTLDILRAFDSDPLYVKLCRGQGCFRARLTPKPWRLGIGKPPTRYPFEDVRAETKFRQWEQNYTQNSANYSVCKLVKEIGYGTVHPNVAQVVALHDRATVSTGERELA